MCGKTVYLGKRVRDLKAPGLDSPKEFYSIMRAIMEDYQKGRISKQTAKGRLMLLYLLTFKTKNKKVQHIRRETLVAIRKKIKSLMRKL